MTEPMAVLDHGFVQLIDSMGTDHDVAAAARVSYATFDATDTHKPREDKRLIRYLMRHDHGTPFEMCLHGDTLIPTMPCPGATQKYYTIRDIADAFEHRGKAGSWIKLLHIRTVNPDGTVSATRIIRAWKSGIMPVFRVIEDSPLGRSIVATANHPILTPQGYRRVDELYPGHEILQNGTALIPTNVPELIDLWDRGYTVPAIASMTAVGEATIYRRLRAAGIDTSRRTGLFTRKTDAELVAPHERSRQYRRLQGIDTCEVCGQEAHDVHHRDKNPHNNDPTNLLVVCRACHKALDGQALQLRTYTRRVRVIIPAGTADVYDLEVASENHNFVANGFVVHNCQTKWHVKAPLFVVAQWQRHRMGSFNQISARYRTLPEEFYVPDIADIRKQSTDNKQGRGELFDYDVAANLRTDIADEMIAAFDYYHEMIDGGVANEIARIVLPTATYTEFYWSVNMRALMNFLRLRMDAHAQLEIRRYATAIASVVATQWPLCWDAFSEYVLHAVTFSDKEMEVLRDMAARTENYAYPENMAPREREEFIAKLGK